jgi:hypothetical protein
MLLSRSKYHLIFWYQIIQTEEQVVIEILINEKIEIIKISGFPDRCILSFMAVFYRSSGTLHSVFCIQSDSL